MNFIWGPQGFRLLNVQTFLNGGRGSQDSSLRTTPANCFSLGQLRLITLLMIIHELRSSGARTERRATPTCAILMLKLFR